MAVAILSRMPNSYMFEERKVSLHEPVKVGRALDPSQPSQENLLFSCRVLSKNHAVIWFEERKFFIRDLNSSNGTFVNDVRLKCVHPEGDAVQLWSGDCVQFGVEVSESSSRVTHSCLVSEIRLFYPDGKEAIKPEEEVDGSGELIDSADVLKLGMILKENNVKSEVIDTRLRQLRSFLEDIMKSVDENSQALVKEEHVLSVLDNLQVQLQALSKDLPEDDVRLQAVALQADKAQFEARTKDIMWKMNSEKDDAMTKLEQLEMVLSETNAEKLRLQQDVSSLQDDLLNYCQRERELIELKTNAEKKQQDSEEMSDLVTMHTRGAKSCLHRLVVSLQSSWACVVNSAELLQVDTPKLPDHCFMKDLGSLLSTSSSQSEPLEDLSAISKTAQQLLGLTEVINEAMSAVLIWIQTNPVVTQIPEPASLEPPGLDHLSESKLKISGLEDEVLAMSLELERLKVHNTALESSNVTLSQEVTALQLAMKDQVQVREAPEMESLVTEADPGVAPSSHSSCQCLNVDQGLITEKLCYHRAQFRDKIASLESELSTRRMVTRVLANIAAVLLAVILSMMLYQWNRC